VIVFAVIQMRFSSRVCGWSLSLLFSLPPRSYALTVVNESFPAAVDGPQSLLFSIPPLPYAFREFTLLFPHLRMLMIPCSSPLLWCCSSSLHIVNVFLPALTDDLLSLFFSLPPHFHTFCPS
jgi:hypothetical protein